MESTPMEIIIKVIGIGRSGITVVNHMIASSLQGVGFIAADTDTQALSRARCEETIQLGISRTEGLPCGNPLIGSESALESTDAIRSALEGADLVFVVAGMGGGAGSGAAPVVAQIAKELGVLTVGVVTRPFYFEGKRRSAIAEAAIQAFLDAGDTLIVIPCDRLIPPAPEKPSFLDMLKVADEVLYRAVKGVSDVFTKHGHIGIDTADMRTVMGGGCFLMGEGRAIGKTRAHDAVQRAISSPLLDDIVLSTVRGVFLNITGGSDISLDEVTEITKTVEERTHEDAQILFGLVSNDDMGDEIRVTIIASGAGNSAPLNKLLRATKTGDGKGISNKERFPQHDDIEDGVFYFDDDELEIPCFIRARISGALDMSDFTWKCKNGLPHRISIEPPYQIHVEQMTSTEGKNIPSPCKVLKFIKDN